jgi:hypothetical protein
MLAPLFVLIVGGAKVLSGCTTGNPIDPLPTGEGQIAGVVVKGPVAAATVRAYKVVDGKRADEISKAVTDEHGAFVLPMGKTKGAVLLVAAGGTYNDEATPSVLTLSNELTAVIPTFSVGTKLEHVTVSPVSHMAATLALFHAGEGTDLLEASATARRHIEDHFGGIDWSTVVPTDLTTSTGAQLDQGGKAGLILAGLSMVARTMAETAGLTPGAAVNAGSLVAALADDLAEDGFFDGMGTKGPILIQANVPATAVDGQTPRTALAQALARFLESDRNHSAVKPADAYALSKAIAGADDPYLFRTAAHTDLDGPTIEWLQPLEDSGVHGSARVYLTAHDASKVTSFTFTEPASLSTVKATLSADGTDATLDTTLDVSALPDGPITLKVRAVDSADNESLMSRTIHVANTAPEINVASPRDGDVVKGTIMITASATVKNGTIAKLELKNPPAGVGADQLPGADSLAVAWDTTKAPEGPAVLTVHAEDTLGASADVSVVIQVDNVAPGEISVLVSAGAPLAQARVVAVAVDNVTAAAAVGRPDQGVLGEATTDETGTAKLVLTGENWDGPIQLRASGSTLAYVDPSDGVTQISIPGATVLTSFVPRYRTGEKVTAPVTLWTTLGDAAVHGVMNGRNPTQPQPMQLTAALALVDPLMSAHIAPNWNLRQAAPVELTKPPAQTLRDVVFAALPNVGLNSLARDLSGRANVTPGQVITAVTVLSDLVADVESDGLFDGKGQGGVQLATLGSPAQAYAADSTRFDLALALDHWIIGPTNATSLARGDIQRAGVYDAIAGDRSILYPVAAVPKPFDSADLAGPAIDWQVPPSDNAGVQGSTRVLLQAHDPGKVTSFVFVEPAALVATHATFSAGGVDATLDATLDVSALPDGPLTIKVRALDSFKNESAMARTIYVANTVPLINVSFPSANAALSGTVTLTASASIQGDTIAKLELRNPPAGIGVDQLPGADSLAIPWDTTKAKEGPTTLTFHAEGALGASTDLSVPVRVDNVPPGEITVVVTAGSPIALASVQILAIDDATGQQATGRYDQGVLGSGAADATGVAKVTITGEDWNGPIQVRAGGTSLTYEDPSKAGTLISIPTSTVLSSFIASYMDGQRITVPVSPWTTLADAAARAVLGGRNPAHQQPMPLTAAMALVDPLFAAHIAPGWNLRQAVPVDLTKPPAQTLRDVVFAALPNVGLNSLARDLSARANVTPGQVITAMTVLQDLVSDVESDGLFDGKGQGGVQLTTLGSPAQVYEPNTTRFDLAMGIFHWVSGPTNATGLGVADLQRAAVYDTIASDRSILYPASAVPKPFDSDPPLVVGSFTFLGSDSVAHTPVGASSLVSGVVTLTVDATDLSGVGSIAVAVGSTVLTPSSSTNDHWVGSFDTKSLPDGLVTFTVTATDTLANSGTTPFTVTVDNTRPTTVFASPTSNALVGASVLVDATASDANGVVSLDKVSGFTGLLDSDAAAAHFTGTWTVPAGQADGSTTLTLKVCDVVTNCANASVSVRVDRTAPTLTLVSATQITKTPVASMSATAADGAGSGVKEVWMQVENGTPQKAVLIKGEWVASNLALPPALKRVQIAAWGVDQLGNSGQGKTSPYRITTTVTLDMGEPEIFEVPTPSYLPEQGLTLASEVVPASYSYQSSTRVAVSTASPVQKASSRVSYGAAPPTPAQLETFNPTNTNNTPFLKFRVPYDPATESALNVPTYTITTTGLPAQPPPGTLLGTPTAVVGGSVYFYLPLSKETLFPGGPGAATSFTFTVSVTTTDVAGNSKSTPFPAVGSYTYTFLAPPLYVTDTTAAWSTVTNAPESAYQRRLSSTNYRDLWDGAHAIRYNRYVISNPSDVAISVSTSSVTGSCGWAETVATSNAALPASWSYDYWGDGVHFYKGLYSWTYAGTPIGTSNSATGGHPCIYLTAQSQCGSTATRAVTISATTAGQFMCMCDTPATSTVTNTGSLNSGFGAWFFDYGGAPTTAETTRLGALVTVPAAANGVPGRVSVYFARATGSPGHSAGTFTTPSADWPASFFGGGSGFYGQANSWDFWQLATPGTCTNNTTNKDCTSVATRNVSQMTSSRLTCNGAIALTADANATFRALPATALSPTTQVTFSR